MEEGPVGRASEGPVTGTVPVKIEPEHIPLFPLVSYYRREWVRPDLLAGLATAAVVIPQAMAYATIAGLPVQHGLYVATVPMLVYAALGTSRPLSVSTTSTVAALTATAIAGSSGSDPATAVTAAATLSVMAGGVLLAAGLLKIGYLADFISAPVLAGFKIGTALVIVSGQLGKVLGVPIEGEGFFDKIWSAITQLPKTHLPTMTLAVVTVAGLLLLRRYGPRIPGALVAFAGGIVAVAALDLGRRGVALVPEVPSGLPLPALPNLSLVGALMPAAFGVALMTFVESIASARAFERSDEGVRLSADRELLALGCAGVAGGIFRALPAAGGLSQTAVNASNGARSPMAGAVTGLLGVLTLLFLTPLFADLADATLGAIVLVAVLGLLDTSTLRSIGRIRRVDYRLGILAILGILLFGVLQGVLVAVVLSLMALIHGVNLMPIRILGKGRSGRFIETERGGEPVPELLVVRPEGGIYFANVGRIRVRLERFVTAERDIRNVVIEASAVPDIETTGAMGLATLENRLAERGVDLWFASPTPRAQLMLRAALPARARARVLPTLDDVLRSLEVSADRSKD
jgi:SulP family sulfate permease